MTSPAAHTPAASLAADLWPLEAIEAIRAASLELLVRVGVRVDSPQAAELLAAAGCTPGPQGRILMSAAAVAAALESCRGEYTVLARDPARDIQVGPAVGRIHVHNMGEAPDIADPRTGAARRATFRDQVLAARVMHHGRYPDSINSLITPGDVPGELHPLYSYLAIAAETDKVIGGPGQDFPWQTPILFEMASAVTGARPGEAPAGAIALEMGYSPVSPLHLGAGVCDGIIAAARLGMAVQVLTNPVAGTTAPASMAGALAQQDAEILAGVVLAQAAAPGAACCYGARLSVADPRDGHLLCGAGQWALSSVGATLLARRHGLACDCYGADTSAPLVDVQAGYQQALPALAGALARPCYLSGIGTWGATTPSTGRHSTPSSRRPGEATPSMSTP
jgi:trimethylamine--corrinoid protein Co-methyltransferase